MLDSKNLGALTNPLKYKTRGVSWGGVRCSQPPGRSYFWVFTVYFLGVLFLRSVAGNLQGVLFEGRGFKWVLFIWEKILLRKGFRERWQRVLREIKRYECAPLNARVLDSVRRPRVVVGSLKWTEAAFLVFLLWAVIPDRAGEVLCNLFVCEYHLNDLNGA